MAPPLYSVYMMLSMNPLYKNKTFVGFTVDPERRLLQHNKGSHFGGAKKTNSRGPWEMVLVISGFTNEVAALQFEWSWNNPHISKRLNGCSIVRGTKESLFAFYIRIVDFLLNIPPWNNMRLHLRCVNPAAFKKYEVCLPSSTDFLEVTNGPLENLCERRLTRPIDKDFVEVTGKCSLCKNKLYLDNLATCYHPPCNLIAHITCLAELYIGESVDQIPINGECPTCHNLLIWNKLVDHIKI